MNICNFTVSLLGAILFPCANRLYDLDKQYHRRKKFLYVAEKSNMLKFSAALKNNQAYIDGLLQRSGKINKMSA
jgi:predicted DNA-binding ArsR family transcriptional regulator